jgi:hypothetical protein
MIRLFGPMRGAYDGPIPTRKKALIAIKRGSEVKIDELPKGILRVNGTVVRLDRDVARSLTLTVRKLFSHPEHYDELPKGFGDMVDPGMPAAGMFDEQCLILRLASFWCRSPDGTKGGGGFLVLFDVRTGRPLALYPERQGWRCSLYGDLFGYRP